jgi:DNA polymerase-1
VHDELVLEVDAGAVQDITLMLREQMAAAETLSVPLKVDIGTGANWDEAH